MLFIYRFVVVVVSKQPVVVIRFPLDLLQKISEWVWDKVWIQLLLDIGGGAVADDIVRLVADTL